MSGSVERLQSQYLRYTSKLLSVQSILCIVSLNYMILTVIPYNYLQYSGVAS